MESMRIAFEKRVNVDTDKAIKEVQLVAKQQFGKAVKVKGLRTNKFARTTLFADVSVSAPHDTASVLKYLRENSNSLVNNVRPVLQATLSRATLA